ncbi:ribosome assembly cofactor RimP [Aureisphaera galaxeae]|uniref:ribosome assembly cofactor RimP n=1 Tax=Aureisphaera galaxeae TaxID=1538023 RepID=UPI0023503D02|nr:ribosome assembly cofactor RimP [Aureisphaera galaxeae]MDC8005824.1 ribosome assembly cofactor RimP [Aureisphaera galaxeae]
MQEKVRELLGKVLEANPSLFLIDLEFRPENQIRVIIDGDQGVKVEDCIAVSRAIEHNLDREEEDFSLEVLSAGVSEPLSQVRQYKKNVGRKLKVKTDEETLEGELVNADEANITLQWKAREPKPVGKGKVTVQKEAIVPYENIVEAKVMVTF